MKEFTEKYTESGKVGGFLVTNYFKSVAKLISKIPVESRIIKAALEIGCGPGFSTISIKEMLPTETVLYASDFEEENVQDTKKKLGDEIEVVKEDVYDLQRENNSMDLIFLLEVMEHLEKPELALEEIKRVLDGYLIIGVPREPIWRLLNMARLKYLSGFGNTPGHVQHWSRKQLLDFLKRQGFEIVAVESPLPWTLVLVREKIS